MFTADLAEAVSTMVWFIHDIDPIQAQYECKPHGTGQSVITVVLIAKLRRKTFQNPHEQSRSGGAANPKLKKRAAHVRLEILHPAKNQSVNMWKIKKYTFRLFDFSAVRFLFLPLDTQRFKSCTFSCACSAGKASGKKSNSQKVKSQKIYFSTFRPFEIHNFKDTFSLFGFLLFDFSKFNTKPFHFSTFRFFDFSKLILHTFRLEPCSTPFLRTPPELSRGSPRTSSGCHPTRWDCRSTSDSAKRNWSATWTLTMVKTIEMSPKPNG